MKCNHQEFPSDVFISFETIDAIITLVGPDKFTPAVQVTPYQLLTTPLQGKLIYSVSLQPFDKTKTLIKTYKIMPRSQNAHAYVNAGFRFQVDANTLTVQALPTLVFGGISSTMVHATKTEKFLLDKTLSDQSTLTSAFKLLSSELNPDHDPVLADPQYRRSLAMALFYKFLLFANSKSVDPTFLSGIESLIDSRGLSSGKQDYSVNEATFPVTKPMSKKNAVLQASGEAEYVLDMPSLHNELHAAFIIATVGNCQIDQIDASPALSLPGVARVILAKDLSENNLKNSVSPFNAEPLFGEQKVEFAGQPIGLVVAKTFEIAMSAAKLVKVTYKERQAPIVSVKEAVKAQSFENKGKIDHGDAQAAIQSASKVIQGECLVDTQFHFYMESQVALCQQNEEGVDCYASTQFIDYVQGAIANALGLRNASSVNVRVKQVGGGYGGKITRSNIPAVAAAVACKLMNRPVRVCIDLNTVMEMIGKRNPWYLKYTIGIDDSGKLD
jgi:xanthine dehydrogenase/oxidase